MDQLDMFGSSHVIPEGFRYREDFLTTTEEAALIAEFEKIPFVPYMYEGYEAQRRVKYFGIDHDPETGAVRATDPIPEYLVPLREKAAAFAGVIPEELVHALVTEYLPGTPIGWHRDSPPFHTVIGVSFGAPCSFRMRLELGGKWERFSHAVEPRSIYVLEGPARYVWQHSIPPLGELRYSVTFRTIK